MIDILRVIKKLCCWIYTKSNYFYFCEWEKTYIVIDFLNYSRS